MHLLNHPVAAEMGRNGLSFAQTCPFAGVKDFGTLCTCANRADSCPEPTIIGTTHGFNVDLPMLGVKSEAKAFLTKYPNYAYLVRAEIFFTNMDSLTYIESCSPLIHCSYAAQQTNWCGA